MSVRHKRKLCRQFAKELRSGRPINHKNRDFLARFFEGVGNGESADLLLGLKRSRGQKEKDEKYKEELALIFHWVRGLMNPETGYGLNLSQALEAAVSVMNNGYWTHPITGEKSSSPGSRTKSPFRKFELETLQKEWYRQKELTKESWTALDPYSPYE